MYRITATRTVVLHECNKFAVCGCTDVGAALRNVQICDRLRSWKKVRFCSGRGHSYCHGPFNRECVRLNLFLQYMGTCK